MRPIHLNLAARPYRDYRPVYVVVTILALMTGALMLNNVAAAYRYFVNTKETRAKIAAIEGQTEQEIRRNQQLTDSLRRVNVGSLATKTKFINARIAERSFSWSQLLDQLEKILPDDVRLFSLAPSVDPKTGTTHIQLAFESKSQGGLIKTLRKFQSSPYFYRPFPFSQSTSGGLTRFTMQTDYNPQPRGIVE